MSFQYFLVLGTTFDSKYLHTSIGLIKEHFDVSLISNFYKGPSEDPTMPKKSFINVALSLTSNSAYLDIKYKLKELEQYQLHSGFKIVDIDLLIQVCDQVPKFVCGSLTQFCHCLVTLNDICPNLIFNGKSINHYFHLKENKTLFHPVNLVTT